jgi:hypothetical protein
MEQNRRKFSLTLLPLTLALAFVMSFISPQVNPNQTANAAEWKLYINSTGNYCEGCCGRTDFCCTVSQECRVKAPLDEEP